MTHYSLAFKPEQLSSWAKSLAEDINDLRKDVNTIYPILVYSGMSGVSAATAISLSLTKEFSCPHGMVYVRKKEEISHGKDIEHSILSLGIYPKRVWIFVDDFIDGANTINYCFNQCKASFHGINQFDYLAVQRESWGEDIYYLQKPENSWKAHNIAFLDNVHSEPNWNPKEGYQADYINNRCSDFIDIQLMRSDWDTGEMRVSYPKSRPTVYENALGLDYSGLWWDEMRAFEASRVKAERPKKTKVSTQPKQNIPFWAVDWRKG
jgi:hypothetical protein